MSRLSGKIAVVVGGHDGIGGAIAERFAAEGAMVHATSRRAEGSEAAHGEGVLRTRRVDASDVAALQAFFEAVRKEEGRVDSWPSARACPTTPAWMKSARIISTAPSA